VSILPTELSVEELQELREAKAPLRLIDCREDDEWHICKIEGAQLIPLSNFAELALPRLPDKSQHLVVYCHHGVRSMRATLWLRQQGYAQTQSLRGGIDLWSELIDPAVSRY
jgi:adenylyltransferase/sulfurtransferase